jgi:hypothetical protein
LPATARRPEREAITSYPAGVASPSGMYLRSPFGVPAMVLRLTFHVPSAGHGRWFLRKISASRSRCSSVSGGSASTTFLTHAFRSSSSSRRAAPPARRLRGRTGACGEPAWSEPPAGRAVKRSPPSGTAVLTPDGTAGTSSWARDGRRARDDQDGPCDRGRPRQRVSWLLARGNGASIQAKKCQIPLFGLPAPLGLFVQFTYRIFVAVAQPRL